MLAICEHKLGRLRDSICFLSSYASPPIVFYLRSSPFRNYKEQYYIHTLIAQGMASEIFIDFFEHEIPVDGRPFTGKCREWVGTHTYGVAFDDGNIAVFLHPRSGFVLHGSGSPFRVDQVVFRFLSEEIMTHKKGAETAGGASTRLRNRDSHRALRLRGSIRDLDSWTPTTRSSVLAEYSEFLRINGFIAKENEMKILRERLEIIGKDVEFRVAGSTTVAISAEAREELEKVHDALSREKE